eukprot:1161590-Pelagomonas_calceolata.AAC.10
MAAAYPTSSKDVASVPTAAWICAVSFLMSPSTALVWRSTREPPSALTMRAVLTMAAWSNCST